MEKQYFGPRNHAAEAEYRACWLAYLGCKEPEQKEILEKEMDRLQTQIAYGPKDKRWDDFIDTLPGFRDFWGRFEREADEMARDIQRMQGIPDGE